MQGREAMVTVEANDELYGMLSIAPSSRRVSTEEGDVTLTIFINREFGASGQYLWAWFSQVLPRGMNLVELVELE